MTAAVYDENSNKKTIKITTTINDNKNRGVVPPPTTPTAMGETEKKSLPVGSYILPSNNNCRHRHHQRHHQQKTHQ